MDKIKPNIQGEMEEFERVSQYLSRDEGIEIPVEEIVDAFDKSKEQILSDEIWENLENTESNEIVKGDIDSVKRIAKKYGKTNPEILVKAIKSDKYHRPLILKFDGRYHLVAGNTRLCTAKAMGVNPKVFIAKIETNQEISEKWSEKYKRSIDCNNPKGFSQRAHCQGRKKKETKEQTTASSSGSFEGPVFTDMGKKKQKIKHIPNFNESEVEFKEETSASSSGAFDVPLFGSTTKGRKNPLKIDGPKSIKSSRAVKDKNFPKWGGPGGIFIKVKEKCKKFPYCNQGDINAIELLEIDELNEAIKTISLKTGVPKKEIESIVLNEIKQIFI
jgi:hypothetical protein